MMSMDVMVGSSDLGIVEDQSSLLFGSSFGSTNGVSINPGTGKPYGPDFPAITVHDIIAAEKALLDELGVKHLIAVDGPSYGGYQAFQWAVG
jgi:homoserine O-acetyltransferase/O-succinyltransferase